MDMSTKLLKVMERAKDPKARFNSLAHLLDEEALERSFHRIRKKAAAGVDGVTKEMYEQNLDENIQNLLSRLKSKRYRHQPIRRVHIPKAPGKTRPIGISCIEDKIVQGALREVLEAIYEQEFLPCSHGFRPNRSAHDALRAVNRMVSYEDVEWILELDFQAFFDSLDRSKLKAMLRERVADGSLLRLIGKCLHVGVLDGEQYVEPDEGTVQGSVISPLFGNVYLHHVLDRWFEYQVKPHLAGHARLIRYADDAVLGFARREDAERVQAWLTKQVADYGLALHPDKTRLISFGRPRMSASRGSRPVTFDFLGFTMFWRRTRKGGWALGMKTRKAKLRRVITTLDAWCRRHRHLSRKEQHAALSRRLQGHYNYFGVNGNIDSLEKLRHQVVRNWHRWLQRRGQRGRRYTWERFQRYVTAFPLPQPTIRVQIWASAP